MPFLDRGHSGRVRTGPLDRHRQPAEAQEARRAARPTPSCSAPSTCRPCRQGATSRSSTSCKSSTTWCRSTRPTRSRRSTTCCWPCSPRRWARSRWTNFVAAVKSGQPTAIFEDPFPLHRPATCRHQAPKMPPGGGNPVHAAAPAAASPRATSPSCGSCWASTSAATTSSGRTTTPIRSSAACAARMGVRRLRQRRGRSVQHAQQHLRRSCSRCCSSFPAPSRGLNPRN